MNKRGRFITFEGIDGSGKTSQIKRLADNLAQRDHKVQTTREPGGSIGAEDIRKLLVEGDPNRWSPQTEILLFTAARRDHLERTIQPALAEGKIVLSDRFADSTRVYQGAVRSELRDLVDRLHRDMIVTEPDLTIVLDMDPEVALKRGLDRHSGEDRFEDFGLSFQQKLRTGFLELTTEFPDRIKLVDASQNMDKIEADILDLVNEFLK